MLSELVDILEKDALILEEERVVVPLDNIGQTVRLARWVCISCTSRERHRERREGEGRCEEGMTSPRREPMPEHSEASSTPCSAGPAPRPLNLYACTRPAAPPAMTT